MRYLSQSLFNIYINYLGYLIFGKAYVIVWGIPWKFLFWKLNSQIHILMVFRGGAFGGKLGKRGSWGWGPHAGISEFRRKAIETRACRLLLSCSALCHVTQGDGLHQTWPIHLGFSSLQNGEEWISLHYTLLRLNTTQNGLCLESHLTESLVSWHKCWISAKRNKEIECLLHTYKMEYA